MSKSVLRAQLRPVLDAIPHQELQQQARSLLRALAPIIDKYDNIGCYMNMEKGELPTDEIIEGIFKEGKSVYLPRCTNTAHSGQIKLRDVGSKPQRHLTFHRMDSFEQIRKLKPSGRYGLREPEAEETAPLPPAELDVILVPGVGFDMHGGRLGHGAGYYDDYMFRCDKYNNRRPLLIGMALVEQRVLSVPMESHDVSMDGIAWGDGSLVWTGSRNSIYIDK
ncbi:HGL343Wp [Eremothecium sinecaudum]|uniref:5-formyltetrahydrofolate cyclo-ligase n=1 Tax=Eremothecium sinecaudum TaxID=45286 RepID=A0A0X8HUY4_9SACH|nr:HGL343Wp [Eremothecium sinecaudum]AMD21997.1 HGL343Wp [Eremothecium sinecaudum]